MKQNYTCVFVCSRCSMISIMALTHWGRVTHICVSKLTTIGSDNGLSPGRRQAIIWTNDGILLIRTLGTNFSEILSKIQSFSFKKMHLKMSSAKWRLFRLGLNELSRLKPRNSCQNLGYFTQFDKNFPTWSQPTRLHVGKSLLLATNLLVEQVHFTSKRDPSHLCP